ncbi:glycosyltransferase family 8 protein [Leuconostoc mesenteroides]|uniref:glycosyltransferase family 8 protein n=1 Tax=Leuconostoc mesenteroides TaxID=1245 RepID=UPI0005A71C40|nr:glycosyltransferase [Leuconostoc mesenteroides]
MKINVLYQSDDNYALVGLNSIVSLIENNQHYKQINIFYISDNITSDNQQKMLRIVKAYSYVKLIFIDADRYVKRLKELNVSSWNNRIVTWCKLLAIADIDIEENMLLYINPHTIINNKLDSLFEVNLGDSVMACVADLSIRERNVVIGHTAFDEYYNCGLMLINYAVWKKEKLTEYCIDRLKIKSDYPIVDQDFCNDVFFGRIQKLPFDTFVFDTLYTIKFSSLFLKVMNLNADNYYSIKEVKSGLVSPKIVYSTFRGTGNPWEVANKAPLKNLWNKYMVDIEMDRRPNSKTFFKRQLYTFFPTIILIGRRISERIKYYKISKR